MQFVESSWQFIKDSIWLVKWYTKRNRKESQKIAMATARGFSITGLIDFFMKLAHIPMNNIVEGGWELAHCGNSWTNGVWDAQDACCLYTLCFSFISSSMRGFLFLNENYFKMNIFFPIRTSHFELNVVFWMCSQWCSVQWDYHLPPWEVSASSCELPGREKSQDTFFPSKLSLT